MVRLTDLVGSKNIPKKTGAETGESAIPKKSSSGGSFLKASDLSSYFELSSQQERTGSSAGTSRKSSTDRIKPSGTNDREIQSERTEHESITNSSGNTGAIEVSKGLTGREIPEKPETGFRPDFRETGKKDFEEADAIHIELDDILDDIYDEGKKDNVLSIERLIDPVLRLIDICRSSNAILRKAVRLKKGPETFTTHSLNVAIVSIKIGISRGFSRERLFSLVLCALLGDIGMTRVDPAILGKKEKLESEEFQEIMMHVEYSRDIVSRVSDKFPFLVPIVYQIHERENGTGYPERLMGGNIHEFAKIIGLSDVYIALTSQKVHREDFSGFEALHQIISKRSIDFSADIIKSLIDVISIFPLESLVKLNNGAIGRVIEISPVHPTRPVLKILVNSDGVRLKTSTIIDLEKEPLLYVEDPDIEEGAVL